MTEIVQRLPVPEEDTPLENLIRLRRNPAFRTALNDLLEWKLLRVPAIVLEADRPRAIAAAMRDFDELTLKYAQAMESEGYKKVVSVGSIFFTLVTRQIVDAIKEGLVSFKEVQEPCWKKISEMKLDLSPFLRQTVKTQNSANGIKMPFKGGLSHGFVSTAIYQGVQAGSDPAVGEWGAAGGGGASV